jgi:Fe-S-cluster containining protein
VSAVHRAALDALYARIPAVDCIPGCTDCCGAGIPVSQLEVAAFGPMPLTDMGNGFALQITPDCPHAASGDCRIHDKRPFICRLFGSVGIGDTMGKPEQRMVCPHGRTPAKPLTQREASALTVEYFSIVREATR